MIHNWPPWVWAATIKALYKSAYFLASQCGVWTHCLIGSRRHVTLLMWCCLRHAQFRPVRRTTSLQPARVRRASACSGTSRPASTATARSSCTSCSTTTDATRPTNGRPTPPRRPSLSTDFSRLPITSSRSARTRAKERDPGATSYRSRLSPHNVRVARSTNSSLCVSENWQLDKVESLFKSQVKLHVYNRNQRRNKPVRKWDMPCSLPETDTRKIWYQITCQTRQKPYQFSGPGFRRRFLVSVPWALGGIVCLWDDIAVQ